MTNKMNLDNVHSLINLTPHNVNLVSKVLFENYKEVGSLITATGIRHNTQTYDEFGELLPQMIAIPSSGSARVTMSKHCCGEFNGFPLYTTTYGDLDWGHDISQYCNLSVPGSIGCLFIVSGLFAAAAIAQGHELAGSLVVPSGAVRDEHNTSTVLGCTGLSFIH